MLYIPGKLSFIHIPRSAGNSITRALTKLCIDRHEVLVATVHAEYIWRHMPVAEFIRRFPEAADNPILAIERDFESLVRSDYKLWRTLPPESRSNDPNFNQKLAAANSSLEDFRSHWDSFLAGKSHVEYWTELPPGFPRVQLLPFDDIGKSWRTICDVAGVAYRPLVKSDFQRAAFESQRDTD